jgi:hypothetical protein
MTLIHVSAQHGDNVNPGTLASPVRQISTAVALAVAGDTVVVLDSGEYGPFRVDKSLAVVAEGIYAQVSGPAEPFGGSAVTVSAGPTDVVVLRGLALRGAGATTGIAFTSGKLRVENCTISNFISSPEGFPGCGIEVDGGVLSVTDTVVRDNSGGIDVRAGNDTRAVIERCRIEGDGGLNTIAVQVGHTTRLAVADSLVSHYGLGFYVRGEVGSPLAALTLSRSTVTNNRIGVYADRTGQVHLSGSSVSLNDTGLFTLNAGIIYTSGDNAVLGNFGTNIGAGTVFFRSDITS